MAKSTTAANTDKTRLHRHGQAVEAPAPKKATAAPAVKKAAAPAKAVKPQAVKKAPVAPAVKKKTTGGKVGAVIRSNKDQNVISVGLSASMVASVPEAVVTEENAQKVLSGATGSHQQSQREDNAKAENDVSDMQLKTIEDAHWYYSGLVKSFDELFKLVKMPDVSGQDATETAHQLKVSQVNTLIARACDIAKMATLVFVKETLGKAINNDDVDVVLHDTGKCAGVIESLMYNLRDESEYMQSRQAIGMQHSVNYHSHTEPIDLLGMSRETRTILSGIRAMFVTGVVDEDTYWFLANKVEMVKRISPSVSVWVEYWLKRKLGKNATREESAIALIDTLLNMENVRVAETTSLSGRHSSHIAVWTEVDDPGVLHCARLSSNTISTFALTGSGNIGNFSRIERAAMHRMIMNATSRDFGSEPRSNAGTL